LAKAEILLIGTELLLGDVLDTNSQFFAQELALLGIDCYHRVVVGDNSERIQACMAQALSRADILITSGGLGPTADDLTTEAVAGLLGLPLVLDEEVLDLIQDLFAQRQIHMPESNKKQALRPQGACVLPNSVGTAPGIIFEFRPEIYKSRGIEGEGRKLILTFPGVPFELKKMWKETARSFLLEHFADGTIWSRELKHFGIGESALAEKYADLLELQNPSVAPYAGRGECRLRVSCKAANLAEASLKAAPLIAAIEEGSGSTLYGYDDDTLESVVGALLKEKGYTLATAESCTGGLVSERLTSVPGASDYIIFNVVTYANEAKNKFLGVSTHTLEEHGAVSPNCAQEMAEGMLKLSGANLAVSITGIAGPAGGSPEKPVGTVYLGLAWNFGNQNFGNADSVPGESGYLGRKLSLPSRMPREEIRYRAANEALNMVRLKLLQV
jgi:nicotinamide-nucleotide amidase